MFSEVQLSLRIYRVEVLYKNWQHFGFEKQGFLDGVCLLEIFTSETNLCLKVYDGNPGEMLTQKLATLSIARVYFYNVLEQLHALYTLSESGSSSNAYTH